MHSADLVTKLSRTGLMLGIALTCPISAWAFDVTSDTTPYISDPSFLPRQGEFYSETTYGYSTREQNWQPNGGAINEHYSADSNSYRQQIEYGITDRFSVGGYGSYADTTQQYVYTFRPTSEIDTNQFNNPTFNATYRAIDQIQSPVSVYVEALFTPGIVANAPRSGGVDLYLNREIRIPTSQGQIGLTIQGEIGTSYDDAYTNTDPLTGVSRDYTDEWGWFVAARNQVRFTPRWAVNSGIVYSKDLGNSIGLAGIGDSYVVAPSATVAPYVAVVFGIVPNRVNLAFEYDHEFIGDSARSGAVNGTWTDRSQSIYEVDLFLRF